MKKIYYVTLFIVICVIFFYKMFFRGLLPVPTDTLVGLYHPWRDLYATTNPRGVPYKNFLITDPVRQQIPWRKLIIDTLKQGKLPSWNPYNFSGAPLLSNIQSGALYPLNIIFFLLPFPSAWANFIMLQPILAGFLFWIYLRSKKIHPAIAVFGAVAWSFSGFFIAWLTWGTIDHTALWLPLILLCIDRIFEKPKIVLPWVLTLTCSLVFVFFAGHIQVAIYTIGFAILYGIFTSVYASNRGRGLWLIAGFAAALAISSIQLLPLVQMLAHSSRIVDVTAWQKEGWFLPWQNVVQFIAPDFFGNPATLNYWGIWNYGEFIGYVGILPLVFVIYGLFTRKDRFTRFYAIVGGILLLFLLPTPIAKVPYQLHLPILVTLQPTRLMVLLDYCLVMLSVLGLERYIKKRSGKVFLGLGFLFCCLFFAWIFIPAGPNVAIVKRNIVLPLLLLLLSGCTLLMFQLFKKINTHIFLIFLIGVLSFDLFRFGWKFTPFSPLSYFFPITKTISFITGQEKPFRTASLDAELLPPNTGAYYGIESVEGYDPIYDSRYEEFVAALNRKKPNIQPPFGFNRIITVSDIDSPLFPLLNAKYLLSKTTVNRLDVELMYQEGETRVYRYRRALPRIFPVASVHSVTSKQEAVDALYAKSFDPAHEAVVEEKIEIKKHQLKEDDRFSLISYSADSITGKTDLTEDNFLVVLNTYDPGWHAQIDGEETKIYRTDYAFSGIIVPEGSHIIRFSYRIL